VKLKPCPFCGEQPSVFRYNGGEMRIECVDPDCQASVRIEAANEQRAVNKWNTRAEEPERVAHWNINCDGYYPYCSCCKSEPPGREMSAYCPACGCKMVTRRNDDT
jgi:Lar family restriction alleviation protein